MLDHDLARLYGVETKRLNEQVRRNIRRFPDDFMFQLTKMETEHLLREGLIRGDLKSQIVMSRGSRSQIATLNDENSGNKQNLRSQIATLNKKGRGSNVKYLPYVFTEQGVAMLSSVLKSEKAILVNIAIMRFFVNFRKYVSSYEGLAMKIAEIEKRYDKKISDIFRILNELKHQDNSKDKLEIGFKG